LRADPCRAWREQLGAFVLDQLDPAQRAATKAHLDGCAACSAEVDSLRPVAALLPRAELERVESPAMAPPELRERITGAIEGERRGRRRTRRRFGLALAGACAALAAAAVLAVSLLGSTGSGGIAKQATFASLPPGIELSAQLHPRDFGTEIDLHVLGIRPGSRCTVSLIDAEGGRVPAGSFRYLYDGDSDDAVLTSALPVERIGFITVRAGQRVFVGTINRKESAS
jgi:putative zinc finger protein